MTKAGTETKHERVVKRTRQGGKKPRLSGMNKSHKRNYKKYRGQGH